MAGEDSLLGTTGKDAIPLEYQVQQQQALRRRAMAQAMMQQGMKGPGPVQMFGNHAAIPGIGEHLISALQTYMGAKRMNEADQADSALAQQMAQAQQGELGGALQTYQTDPRAAISQALLGRFGQTQALGQTWMKNRQEATIKAGDALAQGSPEAGARFIQGGNLDAPIADIPNAKPEFATDPQGNALVTNYDKTGKGTSVYAPKPLNVVNDARVMTNADEDAIKYFNYGGAGHKIGYDSVNRLNSTQNLLANLEQNPAIGAGAEGMQFMRKAAETLGVDPQNKTPITELTAAQLAQRTFDRLGGLGAQVSDSDRKFVEGAQGSISSNPEALRRILLLSAKADMLENQRINAGAKEVSGRREGLTLPVHSFNFNPGSKRNADDLDSLFSGGGFSAPVAPVAATPAGRIKRAK